MRRVTHPSALLLLLLGAVGPLACAEADAQPAPDVACAQSGQTDATPKTNPSFRRDIQPVFAVSCALSTGCHGTDRGAPPLSPPLLGPRPNVSPDDAMLSLMLADLLKPSAQAPGLARVKPGRPDESYLIQKLEGTHACNAAACPTSCGGRMPPLGDPLSPEQIAQIRDWILQGAQNN
jgi:mono/diheme cytochrome c family protein